MKGKIDSDTGDPGVPKCYKMVRRITWHLVAVLLSIVVSLIVTYVLSELQVFWYMQTYHIAYRNDLGNDLGFGLLSLLSIPVFIFCIPISLFFIWKLLKKFYV